MPVPTNRQPGEKIYSEDVNNIAAVLNEVEQYAKPQELTTGADLNAVSRPGEYAIPTSAIAQSLLNGPPVRAVGSLSVYRASAANQVLQQVARLYSTTSGGWGLSFIRQSLGGSWGAWEPTKWTAGRVPNNTNWNTVTTPGIYTLDVRNAAATHSNLPQTTPTFAGVIEVIPISITPNTRVLQRATEYASGANSGRVWQRIQNIDGTFNAWENIASSGLKTQPYKHMMLNQTARKRRGGSYGSDGKTVVALRLDDGYASLISKVLPLLSERGIPASIAVTAEEWSYDYNAGVSWSDIQSSAINHGLEIWNHSNNHTDANSLTEIETTVIGALNKIRSNMPDIAVDGFMPPGVGSSGSGYMGFNQGSSPEAFYESPGGVTILNNHGLSVGRMETTLPLDGSCLYGVMHLPLDNPSQVTEATNAIERSIGLGIGLVPMLHPYHLDTDGKTTLSRFITFLDYLTSKRNSGDIELITVGGMMFADSGSSRRHDLARSSAWTNGAQTLSLADQGWVRGSARELSAKGPGVVQLSVSDDTGVLNKTVSMEVSDSSRARLPFLVPMAASTINVSVEGGTDPRVLAI